jgi:hypothetical protein
MRFWSSEYWRTTVVEDPNSVIMNSELAKLA